MNSCKLASLRVLNGLNTDIDSFKLLVVSNYVMYYSIYIYIHIYVYIYIYIYTHIFKYVHQRATARMQRKSESPERHAPEGFQSNAAAHDIQTIAAFKGPGPKG